MLVRADITFLFNQIMTQIMFTGLYIKIWILDRKWKIMKLAKLKITKVIFIYSTCIKKTYITTPWVRKIVILQGPGLSHFNQKYIFWNKKRKIKVLGYLIEIIQVLYDLKWYLAIFGPLWIWNVMI